jgi:hypothetical protein
MKIRMRRGIAVASVLASLAVAAVAPANANVPGGKGLVTYGPFDCEGLGTVTIVGFAGAPPTGFTPTGEHLVALSFSISFTDLEGNVSSSSTSFGTKAGMEPFTCTATFEHPEGTEEFTMVTAIVPPKS